MRGRERIPGIPVVSQEEVLSTGKARGTPGSCHHSQSPSDVSVHSRETCFPCTTSTFKPRIDSHHGDTWNIPVGKPRGKASWVVSRESHRSFDPQEGKHDTAATAREESARACPHSRRGLTPLGKLQKYPKIHIALERNPQVESFLNLLFISLFSLRWIFIATWVSFRCSAQASLCRGFSCCGAQALECAHSS